MNTIFKKPLPATLARRLAEAADGFRNINQVYFVVGYNFPHPIKDFTELSLAEKYFLDKGFSEDDYGLFGPYNTCDDVEHLNLTGIENITKVDITIYLKNADPQTFSLPGPIDSIFLNLSSFEKFVFPYYCQLYGIEYAQQMRTRLIEQYADQGKNNPNVTVLAKPSTHAGGTYFAAINPEEELPG